MKKQILFLLLIFVSRLTTYAQTEPPLIIELHTLLKSARNNFADDIGAKIDADTATKTVYYETRKKSINGAETFIVHQLSGQNMYVITYDGKGEKSVEIAIYVDQYINELNKMLKTGAYTGEDYKAKSAMDVTDIKDKAGNIVLRYGSTTELQRIYLYGSVK